MLKRPFYQIVESNGIEKSIRQCESNVIELFPRIGMLCWRPRAGWNSWGSGSHRRFSTIISTQDGLSWHYDIVNCGFCGSQKKWKILIPFNLESITLHLVNFTRFSIRLSLQQRTIENAGLENESPILSFLTCSVMLSEGVKNTGMWENFAIIAFISETVRDRLIVTMEH